jgi:hypothetical protein
VTLGRIFNDFPRSIDDDESLGLKLGCLVVGLVMKLPPASKSRPQFLRSISPLSGAATPPVAEALTVRRGGPLAGGSDALWGSA